jgi:hypothetical protein
MSRLVLLAALALALSGIAAASAGAATPFRGTFDSTDTFVDTEVCAAAPWGFDVHATQHEYGFYDVFFDGAGTFLKLVVHNNYDATISANGKTIVERDTWEITIYPDHTVRFTGSSVHIQGPGGIVVRDAGQVVLNPVDGSVSYAHGPHEQLIDNVSFCPALAP